jgi:hypothetical protein
MDLLIGPYSVVFSSLFLAAGKLQVGYHRGVATFAGFGGNFTGFSGSFVGFGGNLGPVYAPNSLISYC